MLRETVHFLGLKSQIHSLLEHGTRFAFTISKPLNLLSWGEWAPQPGVQAKRLFCALAK
jgi:hypothetical protein